MSARGSTITGILAETLLVTLLYFLNTTVLPSLKEKTILYQLIYSLFSIIVFFSFSFPHVVLVSMYIVTK